jgi:hypothetical protein
MKDLDRKTHGRHPPVTPRLVLGLSIMVAGLLMALDTLDVLRAGDYLRYWPVALIAIGIAKLLEAGHLKLGALAWILVGSALVAAKAGWVPTARIWALFIFMLGAYIAWRALLPAVPSSRRLDPSATVDMFAVMGGLKKGVCCEDFKGGQATAFMGGCEIDLRRAAMPGGVATLEVFTLWGGIDIRVPEDWSVVSRGFAFMGGFEDNTRHPAVPTAQLIIRGAAVMGGVEIKN